MLTKCKVIMVAVAAFIDKVAVVVVVVVDVDKDKDKDVVYKELQKY